MPFHFFVPVINLSFSGSSIWISIFECSTIGITLRFTMAIPGTIGCFENPIITSIGGIGFEAINSKKRREKIMEITFDILFFEKGILKTTLLTFQSLKNWTCIISA